MTNELTMITAHKAGVDYYDRNKPTATDLATVARSTGWHGELESIWLAGYFGAKARDQHHKTG